MWELEAYQAGFPLHLCHSCDLFSFSLFLIKSNSVICQSKVHSKVVFTDCCCHDDSPLFCTLILWPFCFLIVLYVYLYIYICVCILLCTLFPSILFYFIIPFNVLYHSKGFRSKCRFSLLSICSSTGNDFLFAQSRILLLEGFSLAK